MARITLRIMEREYTRIHADFIFIRENPRPFAFHNSIVIGVIDMASEEKGNRLCNRM